MRQRPLKKQLVTIPAEGPKRSSAILAALDAFTESVPGSCQVEAHFSHNSGACLLLAYRIPKAEGGGVHV